jgi:hypothetical protein
MGRRGGNSAGKKKIFGGDSRFFPAIPREKKTPEKNSAGSLAGGFDIAASSVRIVLFAWEPTKERTAAFAAEIRAILSENPFQIA